jgi:hypothetical protein
VAGVATGLVFGLGVGVGVGVVFGLAVGLAAVLVCSDSWVRYIIGQVSATALRRLPPRLGRFLSWAQDSGLLRVSGATCQFRHRELQEWLSPRPPNS